MPRVRGLQHTYKAKELSRLIEAYRTLRGYKQSELAEMVGMTQQCYSRKINDNSFKAEDLFLLFDALKMPEETILDAMMLRREKR